MWAPSKAPQLTAFTLQPMSGKGFIGNTSTLEKLDFISFFFDSLRNIKTYKPSFAAWRLLMCRV